MEKRNDLVISPVNGINALGSLHSCSEDNILAGDKDENVFLPDKISRSIEWKQKHITTNTFSVSIK